MSGHGHVHPNPNGSKARCGGPALCSDCRDELALRKARRAGHRLTVRPPAAVDIKVNRQNRQAEAALAALLAPFLHSKSSEIARRIRPALAKAEGDPWDDPAIAAAVQAVKDAADADARRQAEDDLADLVREKLGMSMGDWSVLARPAAAQLEAIHYASGLHALDSIGFNEGAERGTDIVQQLNDDSLDYATQRGGELVGMKWDPDTADWVPNPDAQWAITETTRGLIASDVTSAIEEGWSTDQLAETLGRNYAFSDARAQMIARTEVSFANNAGNMAAYRASGVVVGKVWLAGNDSPEGGADEPCDECAANADQGVIGLDETFQSGDDAPPAHPNCRCAVSPVTDDGEETGEEED